MQLLNGDCLEMMKSLPDKSIDLFICDLPYGCLSGRAIGKTAEKKKCYSGNITGCSWDIKIDLDLFWKEIERLMKNEHTPIIHFCNTRFGYDLIKSKESWFRYDLVWDKTYGVGFLCANKMPMRCHENIYVFAKKGATYYRKDIDVEGAKEWKQFGKPKAEESCYSLLRENPVVRKVGEITSQAGKRCIKSIFQFPNKKGKGNHPTAKPLDLYKFLIERYSKEGDTVLDPTAGSFTSGLASKELNRNYIGIEMDEEFYKKGVALLKECQS
jgi:site-specific DNA-methyltransferase (adenine-specific)